MIDVTVDLSPEEQRRRAIERRARFYGGGVQNVLCEAEKKRQAAEAMRARMDQWAEEEAARAFEAFAARAYEDRDLTWDGKALSLMRHVAYRYDLTMKQIKGPQRDKRITLARHIWCWLALRYCGMSLSQVGQMISRDHTSVLHGRRRIDAMLEAGDPHVTAEIAKIRRWVGRD